jgi:hypothetical protein
MKKYFPLLLSLSFLITVVFLWDYIKLPYDKENVIIGEYYYKKFNPLNDTVRFLLFILIPSLIYLISYLLINEKTHNLSLSSKNYFLYKTDVNSSNSLNIYFFLFITLISFEFFSLNFAQFINETDMFHEGTYLVPPLNYLKTKGLFTSTIYDYGFIANNFGLISNFFLGFYSISTIILIKLLLIYFVKFFLILTSKKVINNLNFDNNLKKIFFIIFTFFVIALPNYYDGNSYFSPRIAVYLFFIFLLGGALCGNKNLNLKFFIVGNFSLISILWWYDIGAYVNTLIFLSIVYLLIHKEFKNIFFIFFGIIIAWALFFLIMPAEEIKEFFNQVKIPFSSVHAYILGIEFRKPFSFESARWTKALLLIYITCLMLIHLNFSKKFYVNYKTKVFISLIFISGIFVFKSALMRSDGVHLKSSSGLYTAVFILVAMLLLFQRLEGYTKIKNFITNTSKPILSKYIFLFYLVFAFLFFSGVFNKDDSIRLTNKLQNIKNFKSNITGFIKTDDNYYLNKDIKLILERYKSLSRNDNCIQILTDDVSFPYFLEKPSCTKFYIPASIINNYSEREFIDQLKKSAPSIILYESKYKILTDPLNMPNTKKYIKEKYDFYENYNGYIFYKIKEIN